MAHNPPHPPSYLPLFHPARQHPDYRWAEAHRLGSEVRMILALPSGDFAVFNAARQLQAILPANATLAEAAIVTAPPEPADTALRMISPGVRKAADELDFDVDL